MTTYRIEQTATGTILWEGEAADEAAAWNACLIAADYTPGEPSLDADGVDLTARDESIAITMIEELDALSGTVELLDRLRELRADALPLYEDEDRTLTEILERRGTGTALEGLASLEDEVAS